MKLSQLFEHSSHQHRLDIKAEEGVNPSSGRFNVRITLFARSGYRCDLKPGRKITSTRLTDYRTYEVVFAVITGLTELEKKYCVQITDYLNSPKCAIREYKFNANHYARVPRENICKAIIDLMRICRVCPGPWMTEKELKEEEDKLAGVKS